MCAASASTTTWGSGTVRTEAAVFGATQFPWLDLYAKARPETEEQRGLAEDKAHVAAMAPKWRAERQQRFEQAFEEWKAERKRRAEQLFAKLHAEDDQGFPPPSVYFRK
jgi:hypothetical protein